MPWQLHQFTQIAHYMPNRMMVLIMIHQVMCSESKTIEYGQRSIDGSTHESGARPPLYTNYDSLPWFKVGWDQSQAQG